jgi:signal peptidase I
VSPRPTPGPATAALLGGLLAAAAGAVVVLRRRFVVVDVEGNSMEPTVGFDDRLVVRRVRPGALRVGDIVVFERPYRDVPDGPWAWRPVAPERLWLIKRLAALPGDPAPSDVPGAGAGAGPGAGPGATVPAGSVAVLGDNRDASIDSREFGCVPLERVLGVAVRRYGRDGPVVVEERPPGSRRVSRYPVPGA